MSRRPISRELPAIQMELLEAPVLADLLAKDAPPNGLPLALARTLSRLESCGVAHGDLKPSNIVWTGDRAVLLDPGFFGNLPREDGPPERVTITTPAYFPLREPDDMMAFGLILVEMASGRNPLRTRAGIEEGLVHPHLLQRLRSLNLGNNYYFDGICALSPRTELGEKLAGPPLAPVIEKCLGLKFDQQQSRYNPGECRRSSASTGRDSG